MTMMAKYAGVCKKCGRPISVGDMINWERGAGASHVECPAAKEESKPTDPDAIKISGGSGYGCHGWAPGEVFRHPKHGILYVLSASKRYFREDGLSFGVGDDRGYIYFANCRPASSEEAAPIHAREERALDKKNAKLRIDLVRSAIQKAGECPEGDNAPAGEIMFDTQNIYGGGEWFVIGSDFIWYVRNNGADGDNWSNNNIRTGGAGAIGWRIPFDKEIADELADIKKLFLSVLEAGEKSPFGEDRKVK